MEIVDVQSKSFFVLDEISRCEDYRDAYFLVFGLFVVAIER